MYASKSAAPTCGACGHAQRRPGTYCEMCGAPLASAAPAVGPPDPNPAPPAPPESTPARFGLGPAAREARGKHAVQFLLLGIPLAGVFTLTPLVSFMGWFLASLVHELGHTLAGWFMGCPSVPAISLQGHAMAMHAEPQIVVRLAIVAASVCTIVWTLSGPARIAALVGFGALYSFLAFTSASEVLFLSAGHGFEVVGACLCLWRAITADECRHSAERAAYAMCGWFLAGRNVWLSFGLAFSAEARAEYAGNGSFGLTNDYIRLAVGEFGVGVERVGLATGVLTLIAVGVTIALSLRSIRR